MWCVDNIFISNTLWFAGSLHANFGFQLQKLAEKQMEITCKVASLLSSIFMVCGKMYLLGRAGKSNTNSPHYQKIWHLYLFCIFTMNRYLKIMNFSFCPQNTSIFRSWTRAMNSSVHCKYHSRFKTHIYPILLLK